MSLLYSGYALKEWCAARKFGSNYVKFQTLLTNIRITTFVCNDTDVKVIDPNKLEVIDAVGCSVREVCIWSAGGTGRLPILLRNAVLLEMLRPFATKAFALLHAPSAVHSQNC